MIRGAPDSALAVVLALVTNPLTRKTGIGSLRTELQRFGPRLFRPRFLTESADAYRAALDERRSAILAALGRSMVAEGSVQAGLDTLRMAADIGWNITLLRELAGAYYTAGKTTEAAQINARLMADPRTERGAQDSLMKISLAVMDGTAWSRALTSARSLMVSRVAASTIVQIIRGRPRIMDSAGTVREWRDRTDTVPTVDVFWSAY